MNYEITFSNSNNAWYDPDSFSGVELDMLKYVNEKLHNKKNKLYNVWVYSDDDSLYGFFSRGKKLEKLIRSNQNKI